MIIPIDQHEAAQADKRAGEESRRATMYGIKVQLDVKKRDLKRHQQKLREITECNATMLSANGDLMIRNEITRLQGEIEALLIEREKL